jgi:hypothetical protein
MTQRKASQAYRHRGGAGPKANRLVGRLAGVDRLTQQAREGVTRAVDSSLTTLYWHVGQRIRQDILKEKRAGYGEQIVSALSAQLEAEFGRGFKVTEFPVPDV